MASAQESARRLESSASTRKKNAIMLASSTAKGGAAQPKGGTDDVKESQGCWRLRKVYRPAFMCTRFFRKKVFIRRYFSENFKPKKLFIKAPYDFYAAKGLSQISLARAMKRIDSVAFHSDIMGICPRYLNPSKGLFWLIVNILDYIYQATFYGGGFSKDEKSQNKTPHGDEDGAARSGQATLLSPVRTHGKPTEKTIKSMKTLNLQERLNLVTQGKLMQLHSWTPTRK